MPALINNAEEWEKNFNSQHRILPVGKRNLPIEWPMVIKPLKELAKPGDKGAGDVIARLIGPIGGHAFKVWYKKLFGQDCGCGPRQEVLNQRWPL